ncbi:MAG: 16S rRNA (uracil(1498)-N(3))-methyltransferase, partial [Chloroflexota bacterium]|nr:16S rRNA (uracil(1498)-N(3))-methyltransferase [Chloroflexota bacterium]
MSHRFLVDAVDGDRVTFSAEQAHQLRHVLRLRSGDRVRVFDGIEPGDLLVELGPSNDARVIGRCTQAAEPRTRLIAYLALLQREKFEPVLQKLTELGVSAIIPVLTTRGLVRQGPDERRLQRWRAIVREAVEQCGRGRLPALYEAEPFRHAVTRAEGCVLLAYERERQLGLRQALEARPATVSLFVGPEGGFTREEAQLAGEAGAVPITL